jgi:hypothetical protein|nr:hypothetical protein [Kofleriaceae bacterium]
MRQILGAVAVVACGACGAASSNQPAAPALANRATTDDASRWVYRIYSSGVESNEEQVQTFVVDEHAGEVSETEQSRAGRDSVPWTAGEAKHWKLAVSRDADLRLALTAADGTVSRYACALRDMAIAPATATRAPGTGESAWKQGRWTVPTRPIAMQVCRPVGDDTSAGPPDLVLAPVPIEHVIGDDNCCGESPSLRLVPADGAIVPPHDKTFPASN